MGQALIPLDLKASPTSSMAFWYVVGWDEKERRTYRLRSLFIAEMAWEKTNKVSSSLEVDYLFSSKE